VIQIAHFAFAVLLNSLWEAPLVAFLTWLCLRAARGPTASTRYVAWLIALLAAAFLPIATANVQLAPVSASAGLRQAVSSPHAVRSTHPSAPSNAHASVEGTPQTSAMQRPRVTLPQSTALAVTAIWALLAVILLARLLVELWHLERFKRDALPLPFAYRDALARWADAAGYGRDIRVCVSPHTDVPVAIGLFDAMILLPEPLLMQLSPIEIEHIALHELAHLRRRDDWFNALERVLVTLFFFNPAIRWIAAQMDVEREVACDDHVVDLTHEVRPYAHCLTKMAEVTQWPRAALVAPGVFITRKSISVRIERLLRAGSARRVRISYGTAVAAMVTVAVVFAAAQFFGPVIAAPLDAALPVHSAATRHKTVSMHRTPVQHMPAPQIAVRPTASAETLALQTPEPRAVPRAPQRHKHPVPARTHAVHVASASPVFGGRVPRCDGCNLSGINWRGRDLRGIVLHGANLSNADLRDADLRGADLSGSNLDGALLQGARLDGARLDGLNVSATGMDLATLRTLLNACSGCNFTDLDGRGKDLSGLHISGVNFSGADLRQANLRNTVFDGVNLSGSRLQGAQLDGASFNGCNFSGVDLRGVDMSRATLTGSNMSGAILQ
jgi:uncharacterized protein YjbI with pentapeptide repeats/beta-lactamase regulating signal transducer with metallopeptidase domain